MAVKPVRTVVPTRAEIHPYYSITTDNRKQRITLIQVHQDQSAYMHTWGGNDTPPPVHIPLFKYRLLSSFREKPTPLVQHKLQKNASVFLHFLEPSIIVCAFKQCTSKLKTLKAPIKHPLLAVTQVLMLWRHQTSPV